MSGELVKALHDAMGAERTRMEDERHGVIIDTEPMDGGIKATVYRRGSAPDTRLYRSIEIHQAPRGSLEYDMVTAGAGSSRIIVSIWPAYTVIGGVKAWRHTERISAGYWRY